VQHDTGEIDCQQHGGGAPVNVLDLHPYTFIFLGLILQNNQLIFRGPAGRFDLYKSRFYTQIVMKHGTVRTSLDLPAPLHRRLHEAAARRGCSARQLILRSIERLIAEEAPDPGHHVHLPLVAAAGRKIRPVTNEEALFS
jgi:hypothetical protein